MKFPTDTPPAGIGLKPQHYTQVLQSVSASRPDAIMPGLLEVHAQNYFCAGGPPHRWLSAFADHVPLSFHSVGLSMGSADGLFQDELEKLAQLCERYEPALVSDHLSWSGSASNRLPDLLPVPYTEAALAHFRTQILRVQDRLKRPMLIENPSRYLAFAFDEMDEASFLNALCARSGCGILLDLNNVEVSSTNLGLDATDYLDRLDLQCVAEIHLAGHAIEDLPHGRLLIDDHGAAVSDATWDLFADFCRRSGPRPVIIEWDTNIPDYDILIGEMHKADRIMADSAWEGTPHVRAYA